MKKLISIYALTLLTLFSCRNNNQNTNSKQSEIIFKDSLGHSLTKNDLAKITGQVNYEIIGDQTIDPLAIELHQEARELGQAGKYDLAILKLEEAIKLQPTWAYPVYDLAFTYLLKNDFQNALKYYKKTNELEPKGFFTVKTALYTLEGEMSGNFPKGLYMEYLKIEWTNNFNKKLEITKKITQKVPNFAPAWKELAILLKDNDEKLEAIEQGLSQHPDAETEGILIINKAAILNDIGKKDEAKQLLGNLIFSSQTTTGNIELAKFTLKSITEN